MGKSGQLWDDSALIKAFDEAIFNYKKMHGKGAIDNSNGVAGDVKRCAIDDSPSKDTNEEDKSHLETENEGKNEASHASVEITDTENEIAALESPEDQVLGPNGMSFQDQAQNNFSSLAEHEYNELYKQYYEVEEQRQKIMQRLQDLSSWSYTDTAAVQWGTTSTQEYESSISQVPDETAVVSCCPCTTTLFSDASASLDLQRQSAITEDVDIVKVAMEVAEKAISTLMNGTSDSKLNNKICNGAEANSTPETDLSAVLNAWYSAGLYTGKYLTEQALAQKRCD